jgi:hypothetical protein
MLHLWFCVIAFFFHCPSCIVFHPSVFFLMLCYEDSLHDKVSAAPSGWELPHNDL